MQWLPYLTYTNIEIIVQKCNILTEIFAAEIKLSFSDK